MPPYAYICAGNRPPIGGFAGDDALTVIDVANPALPAFTGGIRGAGVPNFLGGVSNVALDSNYAYICSYADDRLTIIDISNPLVPAFVSSLNVPGIYDIKIRGTYAFVVTNWASELISIDISNPAAPFIADTIIDASMWRPVSVYLQGDYAYVASYFTDSLCIFDISNPLALAFVSFITDPGPTWRLNGTCYVIVDGNYVYVSAETGGVLGSAGSLTIVDIANPVAPFIVGNIEGQGVPNHMNAPVGLYKVGNLVYVCAFGEWYFNIVDVTNPALPIIAGQLDLLAALGGGSPRPREVIVQGNYAYVTASDGDAVWDGFLVVDIINPAAMAIAGSIFGGGAPNFLFHSYGLAMPSLVTPTVTTDPATGVT